ncbi:MAG TPA: tetratricopeptide repeat protein, partial [Acidimicrobiales bacterium]|nr:tetratricopeptide repeat protein [Acidimicrobiales bacterium]
KDDGFRTIKVMGKETPTEEAKAAFELAGIAFDKGDHATAVQYYRRAYSMPELTELQRFSAANNMGASLERLGDREQAIEIYQEALLFPSVEKVRRARILEALRRLRTGEEAPEGRKSDTPSPSPEERKTADEGASAEIEAGNAALAGGAAQDALAHFTAAYASRNASPGVRGKACFKAGEAHQQLGDFAKALDMYQEALAFPDTGALKPQILERMRQARLGQPALGGGASDEMPVDEQKKVFEEAVAALDAGQYSVALDGFTRVYAVRDAKPEVRRSMAFNMGVCHQRMAHFDEAVSMFEEALGIGGDQAFTLKALDFIRQARRRQVGFGVTKGDETGEPGPPGAEERLFSAEVFYATGGTEPKGNALSTLTSLATRIQEHAKATPGGSYRVVAIGKSSSKWAGADEETADAKNAALSRERADNATAKLADLLPKNLVVVMQPDAKGDAEREQLGLPPSDNSWVERTVGIAVFFTVGAGG